MIQSKIETITPKMAAQMLGEMSQQRSLRTRVVHRYAREMVAGKWLLNGEAIKVGTSGKILDGQHRLSAIIQANTPIQILVIRGIEDSTAIAMDTGVGRNFADVQMLKGNHYVRAVGPIARWWYRYTAIGSPTSTVVPTHQELELVMEAHPSIVIAAARVAAHRIVQRRCNPAVQGFVHSYVSEKYDRDTADLFLLELDSGTGLSQHNAVWHLRRKLIEDSGPRMEATHILALTIKAFNAWRSGEKVGSLRWNSGSEEFPRFGVDKTARLVKPKRARKTPVKAPVKAAAARAMAG